MKAKRGVKKSFDKINKHNHSLNPDRPKDGASGGHNKRDRTTIKRLRMYKNSKPIRDKEGHIIKAAPFQERLASGTVARVEPNRKWFGNTRVIGQKALQNFQEHLGKVIKDPYQVVMRQTKLPITLLNEKAKNARVHVLETETFESTFGPKSQRKKPKLKTTDLEALVQHVDRENSSFADNLLENNDPMGFEVYGTGFKDPLFEKGRSKRIWNELYKVLDSSDVVCQVIDARDPMGTRCLQVERFLRNEKPHKHLILILNKVDLVPTWITQKWIAILSSEYPTVAFHASITNSFGKAALINLLRQFGKLHKDKQQISIGFIGYPNAGKSSIINTLRKKKVCNVAPLAGETKVWQYVTLMKRIFLIDCPGIVYPCGDSETALILKGVVRVENVKDAENHIDAVLNRVKKEYIVRTYQITDWLDAEDFLTKLACRCGRLLKGGEPDLPTAAKMVLNDFQRGKLPYFVPPTGCELEQPKRDELQPANAVPDGQDMNQADISSANQDDSVSKEEETADPNHNKSTGVDSSSIAMPKQDFSELITSTNFDLDATAAIPNGDYVMTEAATSSSVSAIKIELAKDAATLNEVEDEDDQSGCSGLSELSGLSDLDMSLLSDNEHSMAETKQPANPRYKNRNLSNAQEQEVKKGRKRGRRGGEKHKKKTKIDNKLNPISEPNKASNKSASKLKPWMMKKRKKPKHQI